MNMDNIDILKKLGETESTQFFHLAGVVADPITRRILAKLDSNQSPISVDSIPIEKLDAKKPQIITRLVKLEKMGLVRAETVKSQNGFCKKYFINEKGTDIVSKLMRVESKNYS